MLLVAIAWLYVVLMMAAAEAASPNGTLLGAFFTLLLYGVLPLSISLYLLDTPARRLRRRAREEAGRSDLDEAGRRRRAQGAGPSRTADSAADPGQRSHPAGDALASEREEP